MKKQVSDEDLDKQLENYRSHNWRAYRSSVPGEPIEIIIACDICGCENLGDPVEMESIGGIDYSPCD